MRTVNGANAPSGILELWGEAALPSRGGRATGDPVIVQRIAVRVMAEDGTPLEGLRVRVEQLPFADDIDSGPTGTDGWWASEPGINLLVGTD